MKARPEALGLEVTLASAEQVDQALHEMAWLTLQQRTIEAASKARIQAEMAETQAKLVVVIEEQPVTIQDRWNRLKDAIFHWAAKGLKPALPPNKKSLTLAHGVIKTRDLADAVEMLEGKKDGDAAEAIAAAGQLTDLLESRLEEKLHGVQLGQLVTVKFALNKEGIKAAWDEQKRPDLVQFLRSQAVSISTGKTQLTIEPADLQVTTGGS